MSDRSSTVGPMPLHHNRLQVARAKLAGATRRLADIDLMNETGQHLTAPEQRRHVVDRITELHAEVAVLESDG